MNTFNDLQRVPSFAKWMGWVSFAIVVLSIPFSAVLFTGMLILSQVCLIFAGIAGGFGAVVSASLTVLLYTLIAMFVAPIDFVEASLDKTNTSYPSMLVFTAVNYLVCLSGIGIGIWRRLNGYVSNG